MSFLRNKKLHYTFLRLTEFNQVYILGLMEGLKHAQFKGDGKLILKKEFTKHEEHKKNDA